MIARFVERLEARGAWAGPWPKRAALGLVLAATVAVGSTYGLGTGLLVAAGSVLLLAIALFWSSLQNLTGESPLTLEEALHLAAPTAEEEQKRAVLRALKDLEYERSVGKISEEDYRELSLRYREDAKRLIQALDVGLGGKRNRAERLLGKRLAAAGLASADVPSTEPSLTEQAKRAEPRKKDAPTTLVSRGAPAEGEQPSSKKPSVRRVYAHDVASQTLPSSIPEGETDLEPPGRRGPTRRCAPCGKRNDLDARFCKACGIALAGPGERLCSACPSVYDESLDACPTCGVVASEQDG